jgi:hypothetical protein
MAKPNEQPNIPPTRINAVHAAPVWINDSGQSVQPVTVSIRHAGGPVEGTFFFGKFDAGQFTLTNGEQTVALKLPTNDKARTEALKWKVAGRTVASTNFTLTPPRVREIWILPHSHVDIGYTDRQARVVQVQVSNLLTGMELARTTAGNPPGARFKWNVEAGWTVDNFLRQATSAQRDQFIQAAQNGQVDVDALYANLLTGLCQPEELAQSLALGARLAGVTGTPAISAIICDVPGYTWGIVPMFAQAGVKYFAMGPNVCARIGTIHVWNDRPFYWKSQSGKDRVLCWMVDYYHHNGSLEPQALELAGRLNKENFPYDMAYMLWVGQWPNGGVDNAPPDAKLPEKVLAWNAKYAAPKLVIGLQREFFAEFENRHGRKVPEFGGDLTPYWEDGAGSSARETAMNRASASRLSQASALFAMRDPHSYSAPCFNQAWKSAMLYSEHTWGAWCSISKPDDAQTVDQWTVKQNFATSADTQSRALLASALPQHHGATSALDVYNTTQWQRSGLVTLPAGSFGCVSDENSAEIPCQRLSSGDEVFLAQNVPSFGAKRYRLGPAPQALESDARAHDNLLETRNLRVEIDPVTGAIRSLRLAGLKHEFVDAKAAVGLNDFRYVQGTNTPAAKVNGPVTISVLENGPVVAALRIESDAPGCNHLTRDIRVVAGLDEVELIDRVDRKTVREKDAVRFGFGFNIPGGTIRMETPWAVVRPNIDQLPGACHNWFTVQRWVDISGSDFGIGWAPLDAPLMEIGEMTANLLGESLPPQDWLTKTADSHTIYSWAQNNHWFTNYKIDQPGVTTFRYILRPHTGGYSPSESARFGLESARPLIAAAVDPALAPVQSLVDISPANVVAETVKMSEDGKALILRLFNVSSEASEIKLTWGSVKPISLWQTDLAENFGKKAVPPIQIPGYGVLSLRAELPFQPPPDQTAVICSSPLR